MKIEFVNRGLLNIIEPLGLTENDIKSIRIGECMFIITTKNNAIITQDYKLKDS